MSTLTQAKAGGGGTKIREAPQRPTSWSQTSRARNKLYFSQFPAWRTSLWPSNPQLFSFFSFFSWMNQISQRDFAAVQQLVCEKKRLETIKGGKMANLQNQIESVSVWVLDWVNGTLLWSNLAKVTHQTRVALTLKMWERKNVNACRFRHERAIMGLNKTLTSRNLITDLITSLVNIANIGSINLGYH